MMVKKDKIPREADTIAVKRAARVAGKLKKARAKVSETRAWWSNATLEFAAVAVIIILNLYLAYPFFATSAPDTTFSGPIFPLLAKALELIGFSLSRANQVVNISFFLMFPVTFYLFLRRVSGRKLTALLGVLVVSLPFYPFATVRVNGSILGVDSPHIASLTVIPVALHGLLSFLREGEAKNLIIASVFSASVALISPFGFFMLIIFAGILTFSEMLLGAGRLKLIRLVVVVLFSAALNSFWYNPAFFYWLATGPMGEGIRQTVSNLIPVLLFMAPVLGAFGFLLFDRKPDLQPVFLASFFTIAFALIVLAGGGFFPSHPSRYVAAFGMSLSFLISVSIVRLSDFLRSTEFKKHKWLSAKRGAMATSLIILSSVSLSFLIVVGRRGLVAQQERVLGAWIGVEKSQIWAEKERFPGAYSVLGYTITGVAASSLGFLGFISGKKGEET